MFEKFTDPARRVVVLAQEEARMLNHSYIGTEHVLLGLVREGDGIAARVLESFGITLQPARDEIGKIAGRGKKPPAGHIPFTPSAKRALELSLRESLHLRDNFISTEHIMLGLLRQGDGAGVQALVAMGTDLNKLRRAVTETAAAGRSPGDDETPGQ
jgi:ATP-dependent Clp protease ATP-binding subunit ClpC